MHAYARPPAHTPSRTHSLAHVLTRALILSLCITSDSNIPNWAEGVNKTKKSAARSVVTHTCILMLKAHVSVLTYQMSSVSHQHIIFLASLKMLFPSRPHPTLKQTVPPTALPKLPAFWHPSSHTVASSSRAEVWGDAAICPGRTHTSILSQSQSHSQQLAVCATWPSLPCPTMRLFDNTNKWHSQSVRGKYGLSNKVMIKIRCNVPMVETKGKYDYLNSACHYWFTWTFNYKELNDF